MKVVVEMVPRPAMLGVAKNTWMAFAIMADATKVTPRRIGQEDVSAKIDGLGLPHKTSTGPRQPGQVHRRVDCNEDVYVIRDRLGCQNGTQKRNPLHTWAIPGSPHECKSSEQQRAARLGY